MAFHTNTPQRQSIAPLVILWGDKVDPFDWRFVSERSNNVKSNKSKSARSSKRPLKTNFTKAEAAKYLGETVPTVWRLAASGRIEKNPDGTYPVKGLDAYLRGSKDQKSARREVKQALTSLLEYRMQFGRGRIPMDQTTKSKEREARNEFINECLRRHLPEVILLNMLTKQLDAVIQGNRNELKPAARKLKMILKAM